MLLSLKKGIIYGPVNSRRIGSSLGINVLPTRKKICSLNCVYCQYGWTRIQCQDLRNKNFYPSAGKVLSAVEQTLKTINIKLNSITLSGNGEPSLHPDLKQIIDGIIELRGKYAPDVFTAILTNATQVMDPDIRKAIAMLDLKIMKLDCGSEKMFQHYNRPICPISLDSIIQGLRLMKGIIIQSLFTAGDGGNFNQHEIDQWIERVIQISPKHVQIYTLARGYPAKNIYPLEKEKLLKIKKSLFKANINAEVYF
jgi:wyosine [tRNA(Phe)-imidazoG37] synthetase (radical SAM superfamily)